MSTQAQPSRALAIVFSLLLAFAVPLALPVAAVPAPSAALPPLSAVAVSGGADFMCALTITGRVACWGTNSRGQLGSFGPASQSPRLVPGIVGATSLAARRATACAIEAGKVLCWGAGLSGQLGNGRNRDANRPVEVAGISTATAVSVGNQHVCALLQSGAVTCWGAGDSGQLGNGGPISAALPVTVNISHVISIAAGGLHTCAATDVGAVWCWGALTAHGEGTGTLSWRPRKLLSPIGVSAVTAGMGFTCATLLDATVTCWGAANLGQVGSGRMLGPTPPESALALHHVAATTSGQSHNCALRSLTPRVMCWGDGSAGQLGSDRPDGATVPIAVPDASGAVALGVGDTSTCLIYANGAMRCSEQDSVSGWQTVAGFMQYVPTTPNVRPIFGLRVSQRTFSSVTLNWGSRLNVVYTLRRSLDGGATWQGERLTATTTAPTWTLADVSSGTDILVRLSCDGCAVTQIETSTRGISRQTITLRNSRGKGLAGARVGFPNGANRTTGVGGVVSLTALGAGPHIIELQPYSLPNGVQVSGTWVVTFSHSQSTLILPESPDLLSVEAHVQDSAAEPVSGASLTAIGLVPQTTQGNFTYVAPPSESTSDEWGLAHIVGFRDLQGESRSRAARVMLIGDSHAQSWMTPMGTLARSEGWEFLGLWEAGCPWMDIYSATRPDQTMPPCDERLRLPALISAREFQPDLVLFVSRSVLVSPALGPNGLVEPTSGEWAEILESGERRTIDKYLALGASVVLINPLPEIAADRNPCLLNVIDSSECDSPAWYPDSTQTVRAINRRLASSPSVAAVDFSDVICPNEICAALINGIPVRRDSQHLTRDYVDSISHGIESTLLDQGVNLHTGRLTRVSIVARLNGLSAMQRPQQGAVTLTLE